MDGGLGQHKHISGAQGLVIYQGENFLSVDLPENNLSDHAV